MAALALALWFGILTSISPCPLATNIAAISFLSKRIGHPKFVLRAGAAYTLGRMLTYAVLGVFIIASLVSIPGISNFLQRYMNKVLGPLLVLVGLTLLDVIRFNMPNISFSRDKKRGTARPGIKSAFALGVIFALSFCPISAALFFGSLIPLALNSDHGIVLPFVYGIGTALPVVLFSAGIAGGVKSFSRWFHNLSRIELYTRKITCIIFILAGFYYIWIYMFSFKL